MQADRMLSVGIIWRAFLEMLCFFPVIFVLGLTVFPGNSLYYWLLALLFIFFLGYVLAAVNRYHWLTMVLLLIAAGTLGWWIAPGIWQAAVMFLVLLLAAFRGIQYAVISWIRALPRMVMWAAGLPLYFVGYLAFHFIENLQPYQHWISIMGVLFIIILLFMTNEDHLQKESLEKGKVRLSTGMKSLNRTYMLVTFLLVIVITNFQVVQSAVYHTVRAIAQSVIWFAGLFGGEESEPAEEPPREMAPMFPEEEPQEPSRFAEWTELFMQVVAILLLVIGVAFLIAICFKKFRRLLKRWFLAVWRTLTKIFIRQTGVESDTDYEDTKENLFDWQAWRKRQQAKWGKVFSSRSKPRPETAEEKVRLLYRIIAHEVKQREKWSHALTAHEVLSLSDEQAQLQQLEAWYDDIRYGNQQLTKAQQDQIDQLWQAWQEKK
ncbi:DUF6042 family protein [Gracilibacillus timonensis]|uniref:DUF6042 family protein n=1 Tax=Gracilibacillus timonensis TaxID=1816696 RepID=UPI000826FB3B|nr:DUF6042 family protein [Gracilibacillus timonensis]